MTRKEIDKLFEKFEAGQCSPAEENLIDQLLDEQQAEMGDMYASFVADEKSVNTQEDVDLVLQANGGQLEAKLQEQVDGMGEEYASYVASAKKEASSVDANLLIQAEQGELEHTLTSQREEMNGAYNDYVAFAQKETSELDVDLVLKAEQGILDVMLDEEQLDAAYLEFISEEKELKCNLDIDLIVQSQTGSLDELLNQQELGLGESYNEFVKAEKKAKSSINVEELIEKESEKDEDEAKVIPLRKNYKRFGTVAAVFVAILAAIFVMRLTLEQDTYTDGLTEAERIEAEIALQQTLAALGIAKKNLDKGTENMKALSSLKHTNIFK